MNFNVQKARNKCGEWGNSSNCRRNFGFLKSQIQSVADAKIRKKKLLYVYV